MSRKCSQCGASVEVPPELRATTCAFCGSALIEEGAETAEPVDRVVRFSVDAPGASARIGAYLQGQWFTPDAVRRAGKPDELRGVMVPFWAFDAIARTEFAARIGVYWYRTETYTVTVNGKTETRTRQVQETEWFELEGSHVGQWFDQLVSGSRGLLEQEANALEPFDLGESVPYAPALVAGLVAERSTVTRSEAGEVASQELAEREQEVIARGHLPGDTHAGLRSATRSELEPPRLVLLPVWIASVRGPKGPIRILVNGQTGEVVSAPLPTSWPKVAAAVAAAVGAVAGVVAAVWLAAQVVG